MRKASINIILIFSIMILPISCVEIIDIELDSTYRRLVVYGEITTDSVRHTIELSSTTDYFYNQSPPPLINASVSIAFNDTSIILTESAANPGTYQTPNAFRGVPGTTYYLDISNVDIDEDGTIEQYNAETTMPVIESADSISLNRFITPFFSGFQVALWSPEPSGVQYYNYKLLRNGELINRNLSDFTIQPDDFFKNNYISGVPVGFLNDDDPIEFILPGDTVTLEINSITREYYDFIFEAQNELFGNNPLFSGPPANVSSNLSNGAVGIFTAYAVDKVSTILKGPFPAGAGPF
jgi:hypothetical protein